jgi:ketosteroid isomerase-like protein
MSENVEIVKLAYEAFAHGGLDRFMEHFTHDVDYRAVEGAPDDRGPIHGKDALRAWLQDWIDMFDRSLSLAGAPGRSATYARSIQSDANRLDVVVSDDCL